MIQQDDSVAQLLLDEDDDDHQQISCKRQCVGLSKKNPMLVVIFNFVRIKGVMDAFYKSMRESQPNHVGGFHR